MTPSEELSQEPGDPFPRAQLGCVTVFALLLGLAVVMQSPGALDAIKGVFRDGMNGPYRPPPAALATEPPRARVALLDTTGHHPLVFGGLKVESATGSSSVRAVDIRTGWTHWNYREHTMAVDGLETDRAAGDVYITWRDRDSRRVQRVDRVNVAHGKVLWRHDVRRDIDRFGLRTGASAPDSAVAVGRPDGSPTVVVASFFMVAGLDQATGERRWTVPQPRACSLYADPRTLDGTAGVVTVLQACTGRAREERHLLGLDAATGAERWRVPFPRISSDASLRQVVALPGGRLAIDDPRGPVVIDARTGQRTAGGSALALSIGDGGAAQGSPVAVGTCVLKEAGREVVQDGWCGHDVRTGRRLWERAPPDGLRAGGPPAIAGGRVYVLAEPVRWEHAPATSYRFGVLDQRTGTWLVRIPLPTPRGQDASGGSTARILAIEDGVVVIAYPDGRYGLLADTAR